jgi:hypothetical protein
MDGILILGILALLLVSSEQEANVTTPATPTTPAGVQPGAPTITVTAPILLANYNPSAPGAFTPSQAASAAAYYAANPADLSPINPVTGLHTINYVSS